MDDKAKSQHPAAQLLGKGPWSVPALRPGSTMPLLAHRGRWRKQAKAWRCQRGDLPEEKGIERKKALKAPHKHTQQATLMTLRGLGLKGGGRAGRAEIRALGLYS